MAKGGVALCEEKISHQNTSHHTYGIKTKGEGLYLLEPSRIFAFLTMLLLSGAIIYHIRAAMRGREYHVREIAGVQAIEEFIGRATEMGRPVHFSSGPSTLTGNSAPEMLAGLQVLSHVARLCARYDARIIATASQPDVFLSTMETVRQAYVEEGKIEQFRETDVRYLSTNQMAYAAGIVGIVSREKVAANVLIGGFAAESMLLAEACFLAGATQIAGTTNMYQLPFFVVSSDYTLIGEEMFAVGALLSKAPIQLGSLAGQDVGKVFAVLVVIVGILSQTVGSDWLIKLMKI